MTERLLQFIWQFQYFNKSELAITTGEVLAIIYQGQYNYNQGPDFSNARVRIGPTTWVGTAELHIRTSDWNKHHHHQDDNYRNVVLHVVWQDDEKINNLPVLELKSRVPKLLLQRYAELMQADAFIPCENSIHGVPAITWQSWKERLLAERLLRKAGVVEDYQQQNNNHWEETFWWLLARSFGARVNADAFEAIARSIPLKLFTRFSGLHQLEALLFGQSGLLKKGCSDEYPQSLQVEYEFLQHAYTLQPIRIPLLFLRMRPVNFPPVRLAQLAMLIHRSVHLFSKIKEATSLKDVKKWFDHPASDYWDCHYRFDEVSAFKKKRPGASLVDTVIINAVAPVLFAYGSYHGEQIYKDKAVQWLEEITAEINSVTKRFRQIGIAGAAAYDSQALLELKTQYCDKKKCLDCAVGNFLLKSAGAASGPLIANRGH